MSEKQEIVLYRILPKIPVFVRRGIREREWMENTQDKYAYRCLPLTIANQHGYEICLGYSVSAIWNGGNELDDIKITFEELPDKPVTDMVLSHFGNGILTFSTNLLIRTPENVNLYVTGSPNFPKKSIYPLSGIVETDWNPATFTMNWKFLEPNVKVTFPAFEPFCFFYPVQRKYIENFDVSIKSIESNADENFRYNEWMMSRNKFNQKLLTEDMKNQSTWQRHYFQGKYNDGSVCPVDHQTKIVLNDPVLKDE